ncbi:hypothetical protein WA158_004039 [Blastocystis sp. Blastoise]
MSSLAAAQADGYYYPPDWSPSRGSKNQFHKSHPLGQRAKKIDQGIIVVRFEMPYNCWCLNCHGHIARGVRYNAEKKKVGMYYTTPIYEFYMDCRMCGSPFVIRVDPKTSDYIYVSGVKKKDESFNPEAIGSFTYDTDKIIESRSNAIATLEHKGDDKMKSIRGIPEYEKIKQRQDLLYDDAVDLSALARKKMREQRRSDKKRAEQAKNSGLNIKLLPTTVGDIDRAQNIHFKQNKKADIDESMKKSQILSNSVFNTNRNKDKARLANEIIKKHVNYKNFKPIVENKQQTLFPKIKALHKKESLNQSKNQLNLLGNLYDSDDSS